MIIYFSGTGNSKYVAERIADKFNDKAVSVENLKNQIELSENEMFGIVTPVHRGVLPVLMRDFLKNLSLKHSDDLYSFMVTTYGTMTGCTYAEAKHILAPLGIRLTAGFSVKMPDTWTPLFDVSDTDTIRKQNDDAEKHIDKLLELIKDRSTGNLMQHKTPYIFRLVAEPFFNLNRKTKNFYVEETCIGCGLCAKQCPTQAIEIKGKKPVWVKERCALCLRCLHHCPKFAIQYGNGKTKQHGQYRNPHTHI